MAAASRSGYSGLQIALHWTIAALVFLQLLSGESMVAVMDAAETNQAASGADQLLAARHYWFGVAILALVVIRLALRLLRGAPVPVGVTPRAARVARGVHALFYVLLFIVPVTGLLGWFVGDPWGTWHTYAKPVFIMLILGHAAAALYHQFWLKDDTLRRMLLPNAR